MTLTHMTIGAKPELGDNVMRPVIGFTYLCLS